jgi:hypothetical protein
MNCCSEADRKMADRKMADRKMADRKMADRKISFPDAPPYFSVRHFPVRHRVTVNIEPGKE